jgi:hypothetical protein
MLMRVAGCAGRGASRCAEGPAQGAGPKMTRNTGHGISYARFGNVNEHL